MRPFAKLNLRWNPFGQPPADQRGKLAVVGFDRRRIVERLMAPGFALQLLGDCGRGKSTHLRALHTHFPGRPVTFLDVGDRPRIPAADVVFVDESQHLTRRARLKLFRRRASFVLATHEDHQEELSACGIEVETFRVGGVDPQRVRQMVQRRLEWARLGEGPVPTPSDAMLDALSETHGDDLRAIGDALYDWVQDLKRSACGQL